MAVLPLNMDNFHDTVNQSGTQVLVDFYADWCQPCKRIAPVLREIADEYEGKALVCQVNVDENQELAAEYAVMSIPHLISFRDGTVYKRVVGAVPKKDLEELLQ